MSKNVYGRSFKYSMYFIKWHGDEFSGTIMCKLCYSFIQFLVRNRMRTMYCGYASFSTALHACSSERVDLYTWMCCGGSKFTEKMK